MKKLLWGGLGLFIAAVLVNGVNSVSSPKSSAVQGASTQAVPTVEIHATPTSLPTLTPTNTPTPTSIPVIKKATPTQYIPSPTPITSTSGNLDNNKTYINSSGNEVHSPANTTDGSVPAGASARCGDGTYSFSQSRRGTCSSHHGVSQWL